MKKMIATLALAATAFSAHADDLITHENSQDWYATPSIGYFQSDDTRPIISDEDGLSYGIDLGKKMTERLNLELGYFYNKHEVLNSYYSSTSLDLDALFFLNRNARFSPFVLAGVSMVQTDATDDTNPALGLGAGFLSDLGIFENAKLRMEARFQSETDNSDDSFDDVFIRTGIQIPFGKEKTMPAPAPKDTDGDGVMDADDRCPATPAGATVNAFGCQLDGDKDGVVDAKDQCPTTPAGAAVNSVGCELDSDNDGVVNSMDKCPNTPAGYEVDANGCAIDGDDDRDGVRNSVDQCPNTTAGARVDFKGCEINEVISLPGVNFETNSATLTSSSAATLDGAASTLNKFTDINAEVAGHTDSTGSAAYNKGLSQRRAASVRDYLVSRGVSADRLTSRGYGEEQPAADNSTAAGRAANRRVELKVNK